MTRAGLAKSLLLFALLLAAANVAVHWATRHTPARLEIAALAAAHDVDCIALGNSLIAAGFAPSSFDAEARARGRPCPSINAGLGATQPVEHLMMLRQAWRGNPAPRVVIYGFYDFQLTASPKARLADLIGNRSIGLYVDRTAAREYYGLSFGSRFELDLLGRLPMYVDRGNAYKYVERLRRFLSRWDLANGGAAAEPADRFHLLEAGDTEEFVARCREAVARNAPLSPPVAALFAETARHGARMVVVLMPMPANHRARFYDVPEWSRYLAHVRTLVAAHGGQLIDASDWVSDPADFVDALHLAPDGAILFSRRLAAALVPD